MKHQILIIDDERSIRDAFELALSDDYDVKTAPDGLEGLQLIKQQSPDLVFLDLKMPEIDGVETLRRIKAHDKQLPVYIVTAFQSEFLEELTAASEQGLQFEIAAKPLNSEQIRQIASAVLGN